MPVAMVIVLMWSTFAHVFENAVYQFLGLILLFFFFNTSLFVWSILALDREEGKVGICLIEFGSVSSSLLDI